MKINIVFLGNYNNNGIGGGDRKFGIYFNNLNEKYFNKFFIYLSNNNKYINKNGNEVVLTEDLIFDFINENKIDYIYFSGAIISKKLENKILEKCIGLVNVNFTPIYSENPRILNLIISKTDYWKLKFIHGDLKNSYVVYNPIDFEKWLKLSTETGENFRNKFKYKKFIIGRIARAEPSKWNFLIIATLLKLQLLKNYNYGFIFAGMPYFYRAFLKIFLNNEMLKSILFLPEYKEYNDIAKFYKSIDLFWQTSWIGESFGNVIAEAFCFKIPVITDFKGFYNNGKVNKKLYDAQIELVDDSINGYYLNYPNFIISKLNELNLEKLNILGENGFNKVRDIYNVKFTSDTLAKILYDYGKKNLGFENDEKFEKLNQIPCNNEVNEYKEEYLKRLETSYTNNNIGFLSKILFLNFKYIWTFFEYVYLIYRKILMKYFNINIEKKYEN
nr:glycosyltransferase [Candidatus Gracilibacteria bacterium]